MKQIAKTQQVVDRMRAAFGPDVDVSRLPVFEAVALNSLPLRKSGGIFKGAINTQKTLTDIASTINQESAPIQLEHGLSDVPLGRVFYCEVVGDELRALFTCTDPERQADLESGTLDQVSVGFLPASINCSSCGFNYLGADATSDNYWSLTCNNGHELGSNGVYAVIDGVASFYELSLVGKGAAKGARIVGPSESRLQGNQQFKLAASSRTDGFAGVYLSATQKETPVDLKEILSQLKDATTESAQLGVRLTSAEHDRDEARATVARLQEQVTELEALRTQLADTSAKDALVTAATAALHAEATTILTACGKEAEIASLEGKDVTALLTIINEHRAQFAAAIPIGGVGKPAHHKDEDHKAAPSTAAFSTRR